MDKWECFLFKQIFETSGCMCINYISELFGGVQLNMSF